MKTIIFIVTNVLFARQGCTIKLEVSTNLLQTKFEPNETWRRTYNSKMLSSEVTPDKILIDNSLFIHNTAS